MSRSYELVVWLYFAFLRVVATPLTFLGTPDVDLLFVLTFYRRA